MGGEQSSVSHNLSSEEAKKRLSNAQQDLIREWIKKNSKSNQTVDVGSFVKSPVMNQLPASLSKKIFCAIAKKSSAQSMIDSNSLIIALCMVSSNSKREEKIGFAASVFEVSVKGKGKDSMKVTLEEMVDSAEKLYSIDIINQRPPPSISEKEKNEQKKSIISNMTERCFAGQPVADLGRITKWLSNHEEIAVFICFLLEKSVFPTVNLPPSIECMKMMRPPQYYAGSTTILSVPMACQLRDWLPPNLQPFLFYKLFASKENGYALSALLHRYNTRIMELEECAMVIIECENGTICGAFADKGLRKSCSVFYGGNENFLFSLAPTMEIYRKSEVKHGGGRDENNCIYSDGKVLGFGGNLPNQFGIGIDDTLTQISTRACGTYDSPPFFQGSEMDGQGGYTAKVANIEVFGLLDPVKEILKETSEPKIKQYGIKTENDTEEDLKDHEKGVLGHKQQTYVLDMLEGRGYSNNLEDVK